MIEPELFAFAQGIAARAQPGAGDKVLWLHGYTLDSSCWSDLWQRLPGWHHVAIDLPGHGASEPMIEIADLPDLGRRLGSASIAQDVRHIVALSFGTLTALQIGIEFPDAFASFVLGGPTIAGGPQDPDVAVAYAELAEVYRKVGPGIDMQRLWMSCAAWDGIDAQPVLKAKLGSLVAKHGWAEMGTQGVRRFLSPPHRETDLARLRAPVLLMLGDLELPAFRESAAILERTITDCSRCELHATHHLCMLESPGQAAPAIDAHLRLHATETP